MTKQQIKRFIEKANYSTMLLPFYNQKKEKLFAYEALSRFTLGEKVISSSDFFRELHSNIEIFFYLEQRNKIKQIKEANLKHKLILHFDAAIFSNNVYRSYWKEFLEQFKDSIIIEITSCFIFSKRDIKAEQKFVQWLHENEFEFMLTYGTELNPLSFTSIEKASYIKIDKELFLRAMENSHYSDMLESFIHFCHAMNIKTVAHHIDTKKEANLARHLGVKLVQGDFYRFSDN